MKIDAIQQKWNLMKRTFGYFEKRKYVWGVLLGSFEMVLTLVLPYINKYMIEVSTQEITDRMIINILAVMAAFILLAPIVMIGKYFQNVAAQKAAASLQIAVFEHTCRAKSEAFFKYTSGEYLVRLSSDTEKAVSLFSSYGMTCLIRFVIILAAATIMLLVHDWRLAVIGFVYSLLSFSCSITLNPYVKKLETEAKEEVDKSASYLVEGMRGIQIVKVFSLYTAIVEKYKAACSVIRKKRILFRSMNGIAYGVVDFFTYTAQAVGFIVVFLLTKNCVGNMGNAVYYATLMGLMAEAMLKFGTFLLLAQPHMVAMERVSEVLDLEAENTSAIHSEVGEGKESIAVEVKGVSYAYSKEQNVVNNVTLTIAKGEHLAIVGGSGGGKSTLIKLIQRLYEPTKGTISYFGKTNLTIEETRKLIAYIPQERNLFDGTLKENIAFGHGGCTDDEIMDAAQKAHIHEFIVSLPEAYDTSVGERGELLSGGQKQRIAIARAILKDTPIIVLDEATAALDSEVEKKITEEIEAISKDKTTITIAHRLSTIKNADRIVVMEQGRIVEEGNFDILMNQKGRFFELYEMQYAE